MQDLIKRIEAADGPSRELDMELFNIVADGNFWPENKKFWEHDSWSRRVPIRFTSSIDAAMTLVREGWAFNMGNDVRNWAHLWIDTPDYDGCPVEGCGKTTALALCAAALRARNG